jgi:hypothetical protein
MGDLQKQHLNCCIKFQMFCRIILVRNLIYYLNISRLILPASLYILLIAKRER